MDFSSQVEREFDPELYRSIKYYIYKHKNKYSLEINLHFVNIKELNDDYKKDENKLASSMVAYL